jgi:hypothetical protein
MTSSVLFFLPYQPIVSGAQAIATSGSVEFYTTGTTVHILVFYDYERTVPAPNPVPANAAGKIPAIYWDATLTPRVVVRDSSGAVLSDTDPYVPSSAVNAATEEARDEAVAAAALAVSAANQALAYGNIAQTSASSATLASAIVGSYPNAAATNVPRGLTQASVGAITPGATGTNGTFPITWSGGNFSINPTGTFTVAGGVLTAVTITGPGQYIGAAPTPPTPSFAASAGLAGAAVVLTAQFLVAAGQGYWVQSADNLQLLHYLNVAGVATADATVGPVFLSQYPTVPNGTVQRWIDLGGTASAITLAALRTLEDRLRAWGLDQGDLVTLNVLCGTGTLSPRIPFYLEPGAGICPITGTLAAFTEANGLVLVGSTGLNTGITVQSARLGHYGAGLGVYIGTNPNTDSGFMLGGTSGGWGFQPYAGSPSFATSTFIFFDFVSRILGDPRIDHNDGGVASATYVAVGAMAGMRDTAGNGFVMRDGVSLQGGSYAGPPNDPTAVYPTNETFAVRGNIVPPFAYWLTRGMTEARMAALMWAIEEFQIAIGRGANKGGL